MIYSKAICLVAGLVCVFLVVPTAVGQAIEEIVVTAQKREQRMQDVGVSVSVLSGDRIQRMGLDRLDDYADFIPGLYWSGGERAGPNLVVRGVSNNRQGSGDVNIASLTTAMLFGDVPVMNVDPRLPDLQRVEVLKGPQGTLYGAAAMGGLIKFVPNPADTSEFSGMVSVTGGLVEDGGDDFGVDAVVNIPVIEDVLGVRAVVWQREEDGFVDLRIPGEGEVGPRELEAPFDVRDGFAPDGRRIIKDVNDESVEGLRLSGTYTPNPNVRIRPTFMYQKRETKFNHIVDETNPQPRFISRFVLEPANQEFKLFTFDASVNVGPGTLDYIYGLYERDIAEAADFTNCLLSRLGTRPDGGVPDFVPLTTANNNEQSTHELRYTVEGFELGFRDMTVDLVGGVFYQDEERFQNQTIISTTWNLVTEPANQIQNPDGIFFAARTETEYEQIALFADITLNLTDKLSIAGGVRYFDQEKDSFRTDFGDLNGFVITERLIEEDGTNFRAQVTYNASDQHTMFANFGEGFRIGGVEADISEDPICSAAAAQLGLTVGGAFESDAIESYEVGTKSLFLDNRLNVKTSFYFIDWTDLQQQVQLSQVDPACGALLTFNVGEAENKGFELELDYTAGKVSLFGSASFTDAEVTESPPGGGFSEGDEFAAVPEWTFAAGGEYRSQISMLPGWSGYLRADWRWVDSRISTVGDPDTINPFVKSSSYNMTNLRMGFENNDWSGAVFVDNLFDHTAAFSSRVAAGQGTVKTSQVNRPRTVGLTITRNFGALAR